MDTMFKKILIASDGSQAAEKAIDLGINLAVKYQAEVAALYIINPMEMSYDDGDDDGGKVLDKITEKGKKAKITVIEHIITADPLKDFKIMICKINPDLVVIGKHGFTYDNKKYDENRLGSVAQKVLEVSNVPVIIAN